MGFHFKGAVLGCLLIVAGMGCRTAKPKPIKPRKPVPPGTVRIEFIRGVRGPVDLTIDGIRLPVTSSPKKQSFTLLITGLAAGKHQYFLTSPRDSFSPDQGELEISSNKGVFIFCFSQHFDSVLYGKPDPVPPAEGLPGVAAKLE